MMEKLGKEEKDRRERGNTHQGFLRRLLLLGRNTNVPVSHGAGPQGSTTARDILPGQRGVARGQPWTLPCAEEQGRTWTFRLDTGAGGNARQHPYARETDTWDGAEGTGERGGASRCYWYPRPTISGWVQGKNPPDLAPGTTQPPPPPKSLPACPAQHPAPSTSTARGDALPAARPSRGAPEPPPGWRWDPAPPALTLQRQPGKKMEKLSCFGFACLYFSLQPPPFLQMSFIITHAFSDMERHS